MTTHRASRVEDSLTFTTLSGGYDPDSLQRGGPGFRIDDDGVVTAFVHSGPAMGFLAYLEFRAGQVRGNHHHRVKVEHLCVLRGELSARYHVAGRPDEVLETTIPEGGLVIVQPGCVHTYTASAGPVTAVEFSPQPFDPGDTVHERNVRDG